jgi:cytoskeletal protein RodZ
MGYCLLPPRRRHCRRRRRRRRRRYHQLRRRYECSSSAAAAAASCSSFSTPLQPSKSQQDLPRRSTKEEQDSRRRAGRAKSIARFHGVFVVIVGGAGAWRWWPWMRTPSPSHTAADASRRTVPTTPQTSTREVLLRTTTPVSPPRTKASTARTTTLAETTLRPSWRCVWWGRALCCLGRPSRSCPKPCSASAAAPTSPSPNCSGPSPTYVPSS